MKTLSVIMMLVLISVPFITFAQQSNHIEQAIKDAKADVQTPYGWLGLGFGSGLLGYCIGGLPGGCIGGSLVLTSTQVFAPVPPAHRLMGKSYEYVNTYRKAYQSEVKIKRLQYSAGGCLGGISVSFFSFYILIQQLGERYN